MGLKTKKLILFDSAHHSIKSEEVLRAKGIEYQMAAVPPEISADCGAAISIKIELEELIEIYEKNNILLKAIYEIKEDQGYKEYKKVFGAE